MIRSNSAFAVSLALATLSFSSSTSAQTTRDLDSHEHGAATMNVALDNGGIFIELESPWDNLIGFEHAPETDAQHKLVDDAVALLNNPGNLFSFTGTTCSVTKTSLENGLAEGDDHHDHDDDHHDDDHDDKHDDDHAEDHDKEHEDEHHDDDADGHDDHDDDHKDDDDHGHDHDDDHKDDHDDDHADGHDDHDDHAENEDSHSSILLSTEFKCDDIAKLTAIEASFIKTWSGFEDLDVQLIGQGGQAAVELNQSETLIDVTQVQ